MQTAMSPKKKAFFYIFPPLFIYLMTMVLTLLINKMYPDTTNKEISYDTTIVGANDSTIITNRIMAYERADRDSSNSIETLNKLNSEEDNLEAYINQTTQNSLTKLNEPIPQTRETPNTYTTNGGGSSGRRVKTRESDELVDNYIKNNTKREEYINSYYNTLEPQVPTKTEPVKAEPPVVTKNNIKLNLAVIGGGNYKNNQTIKLRVLKEVTKDDIVIKKGTIVFGKLQYDNSKVYITIAGGSINENLKYPFRMYEDDELGMVYSSGNEDGDKMGNAKNEAVRDITNDLTNYIPGMPIVRTLTGSMRALVRPNGKVEEIYIQDNIKFKFE